MTCPFRPDVEPHLGMWDMNMDFRTQWTSIRDINNDGKVRLVSEFCFKNNTNHRGRSDKKQVDQSAAQHMISTSKLKECAVTRTDGPIRNQLFLINKQLTSGEDVVSSRNNMNLGSNRIQSVKQHFFPPLSLSILLNSWKTKLRKGLWLSCFTIHRDVFGREMKVLLRSDISKKKKNSEMCHLWSQMQPTRCPHLNPRCSHAGALWKFLTSSPSCLPSWLPSQATNSELFMQANWMTS